jgi:hypothetical protein
MTFAAFVLRAACIGCCAIAFAAHGEPMRVKDLGKLHGWRDKHCSNSIYPFPRTKCKAAT